MVIRNREFKFFLLYRGVLGLFYALCCWGSVGNLMRRVVCSCIEVEKEGVVIHQLFEGCTGLLLIMCLVYYLWGPHL